MDRVDDTMTEKYFQWELNAPFITLKSVFKKYRIDSLKTLLKFIVDLSSERINIFSDVQDDLRFNIADHVFVCVVRDFVERVDREEILVAIEVIIGCCLYHEYSRRILIKQHDCFPVVLKLLEKFIDERDIVERLFELCAVLILESEEYMNVFESGFNDRFEGLLVDHYIEDYEKYLLPLVMAKEDIRGNKVLQSVKDNTAISEYTIVCQDV